MTKRNQYLPVDVNFKLLFYLILFTPALSSGRAPGPGIEVRDSIPASRGYVVKFGNNPLKSFVVGMETAGAGFNYRDSVTFNKMYGRWMRFEPNVSWYFYKNLGIGVRGRYEFFRSNFLPPLPDLYELGVFTRYYLPIYSERRILKKLLFFVEFAFSKSNYHYIDNYATAVTNSNFSQSVIRIPFGFSFDVWKGINIQISPRYENFLGAYSRFDMALGICYHFNRK